MAIVVVDINFCFDLIPLLY